MASVQPQPQTNRLTSGANAGQQSSQSAANCRVLISHSSLSPQVSTELATLSTCPVASDAASVLVPGAIASGRDLPSGAGGTLSSVAKSAAAESFSFVAFSFVALATARLEAPPEKDSSPSAHLGKNALGAAADSPMALARVSVAVGIFAFGAETGATATFTTGRAGESALSATGCAQQSAHTMASTGANGVRQIGRFPFESVMATIDELPWSIPRRSRIAAVATVAT